MDAIGCFCLVTAYDAGDDTLDADILTRDDDWFHG